MNENEPIVQSFKRCPQKHERRDFAKQREYRELQIKCQRLAWEIRAREREKK